MDELAREKQPLVTVITLAYHSSYLQETIDSILRQNYFPLEYIISDDGTPDFDVGKWERYIEKYPESPVKQFWVLHHTENIGTVKNLNCALHHANGRYYVILAGDDVFADENVIRDWVNYFQNQKITFATSYMDSYDNTLTQFLQRRPSEEERQLLLTETSQDLFECIAKENFVIGCTTAYTAEFWERFGDVPERYRLVDDYPILLRAFRQGEKIGFFPRVTIKYREGGVSDVIHFDNIYQKDSDLIYKWEIAPYTKYPLRAWWNYYSWKWKRKNDYFFMRGYSYCEKHSFGWGLLAIRHPIRAMKKIQRTIQGERR